jgi:hypothetical protein
MLFVLEIGLYFENPISARKPKIGLSRTEKPDLISPILDYPPGKGDNSKVCPFLILIIFLSEMESRWAKTLMMKFGK